MKNSAREKGFSIFKVSIIVLGLSALLVLMLSMTACKSKEEQIADFSGTWNMESVVSNSSSTPDNVMDHLNKSGLAHQLILQNNGTGTLDLAGTKSTLTWEPTSDTEISLNCEDHDMTANLKDDKLTLHEGNLTMVFVKK